MARLIQYFDKAYYNHIGIAKWIGDRLFTVDMWYYGIELVPLSRRMRKYKHFYVVRAKNKPNEQLVSGINDTIALVESETKYDYFLLPRVAILKKTGIDFTRWGKKKRFICSELAQFFTDRIDVSCYKNIHLITPQDFLRYQNESEIETIIE
jgi:hypothetical protein